VNEELCMKRPWPGGPVENNEIPVRTVGLWVEI
jgi:hypothetical protein